MDLWCYNTSTYPPPPSLPPLLCLPSSHSLCIYQLAHTYLSCLMHETFIWQCSNVVTCSCINDKFNFFQARTQDPCTYYSCDEQFSPAGEDGDDEHGEEDESIDIYNVRNPNADARPSLEGSFYINVLFLLSHVCWWALLVLFFPPNNMRSKKLTMHSYSFTFTVKTWSWLFFSSSYDLINMRISFVRLLLPCLSLYYLSFSFSPVHRKKCLHRYLYNVESKC